MSTQILVYILVWSFVIYAYPSCRFSWICLLFMMLLDMVEDTQVQRCISSFISLCHGCNTLCRICNQYMLAQECFTVQTWVECRFTHLCCHSLAAPRICPSVFAVHCYALHASHSCLCYSLYTSLCALSTG